MKGGDFAMLTLGAFAVLLLCLGHLYMARYIVRYEVGKQILQIKLFGLLPLRRIKLENIVEIRIISAWVDTIPFSRRFQFAFLIAERWPSYVYQRKGVFIRKRTGISRFLILSPQNPEEFTDKILEYRRMLPEGQTEDGS